MSLRFITDVTGDRTSDRTIVNVHFILVKYILFNDNSYNKYWCNTHNVQIFKGMLGNRTVTHKIDLIKIEHFMTKRKSKTEKFTYVYAASYEIHMK